MERKRSKLFGRKLIRAVPIVYLAATWITISSSLVAMQPECAMQMVTGCHLITVIVR